MSLCAPQAYDSHCNLVLGEVEETIYVVDDEEDEQEEKVRTVKKQSEMLFVRGKTTPYFSCACLQSVWKYLC